jgi:uncharacterized protein YecE (DUF72 family)
MTIKAQVGTSGFGIAQTKYAQLFSCVEVQHTFYQPPKIATLERWRAAAPPDFEFVLKAWQLITHDARSPTYRRLKRKLSEEEKHDAGYFRSTPIVTEAWEVTLACANALRARTILFQCPASFKQNKENISNLQKFFRRVNRQQDKARVRLESGSQPSARASKVQSDALNLCWEPRGDWDRKVVKTLCDELNLCHAVDPFTSRSLTADRLYFRLHGRNGWRYAYDESELRELTAMLPKRAMKRTIPYVFFNNVRMIPDALSFKSIISET